MRTMMPNYVKLLEYVEAYRALGYSPAAASEAAACQYARETGEALADVRHAVTVAITARAGLSDVLHGGSL